MISPGTDVQQFFFHKQLYPLLRFPVPTESFSPALAGWLQITDVREQRRYLAMHSQLSKALAELEITLPSCRPGTRVAWQLERDCAVLRRFTETGELNDAYVNVYGGLAKEVPPWLLEVEKELGTLLDHSRRLASGPRRRTLLTGALDRLRYQRSGDSQVEAAIVRELAISIAEDRLARRIEAFEEAIKLASSTLDTYHETSFPRQWAEVNILLSLLQLNRLSGNLPDNYEIAFECLDNALRVFGANTTTADYSEVQVGFAEAYLARRTGERRANQENSIACFEIALKGFTVEGFPLDRARTLYLLGSAYWQRIEGDRALNMEEALAQVRRAADIWQADRYPLQHARAEHGLGLMYSERVFGDRRENLERAVIHTREALHVHTRADFPVPHGQGLLNLGRMLCDRIGGDRSHNLEEAISLLTEALTIRTFEDFPNEFAVTQVDLAEVYQKRIIGIRAENITLAIKCYQEALRVWTVQYSPHDNRSNLLRLAELYGELREWGAAAETYALARQAEDLVIALGSGIPGQDAVLRHTRDSAVRHGYALLRLGEVEEAAVRVEQGRARALADELATETADESLIKDQYRRERYQQARAKLADAQSEMARAPAPGRIDPEQRAAELGRIARFHVARTAFNEVIDEIRGMADPADFLQPTWQPAALSDAAGALGPRHAVVYLGATPWGGFAIIVRCRGITSVNLPELTDALLAGLLERHDDSGRTRGGFALAQTGECLRRLVRDWAGNTLRACAGALEEAERVAADEGQAEAGDRGETLAAALREALAQPLIGQYADKPFDSLEPAQAGLVAETLAMLLLSAEIRQATNALACAATAPLAAMLDRDDLAGLAVIPCGSLAAFPLTVLIPQGMPPASVLPSARFLLRTTSPGVPRTGVVALGGPQGGLPWAITEANSLGSTARRAGLASESLVKGAATRTRFLDAIRDAAVVGVSCHSSFDRQNMLFSAIHFAHGEKVTVGEMFANNQGARGLRLLILSACQTAVLDLEGAVDEVHTMAGAVLHAGSKAALASLWAVDDRATCLLITRFAQEWFPSMNSESPAVALDRAQQWLRTATNSTLLHYEESLQPQPTIINNQTFVRISPIRGRAWSGSEGWPVRVEIQPEGPDECPYADPYYWSGFQLIGWLSVLGLRHPGSHGG